MALLAASTEGVDLARLLLDLLIVLLAAKLAAELAERCKVPAVLGEIAAGIVIGPSVLNLLHLSGDRAVSMGFVAELGVILLLLQVGMEMDLAELGKVGTASLMVAVVGVVLPFVGGTAVGVTMGEEVKTAIFLGAALTATSVGITARVFGDLRALATTEARVVLGAAVADDVLGLVILTVVVKVVTGGSIGVATVAGTLGLALVFLVVTGLVGLLLVPRALNVLYGWSRSSATIVVAALVITLAFAELADAAKLAFIIGAFMAGLALGRTDHRERISHDLSAIGNVLIPVFFVQIGINTDVKAMFSPSVLGLAALLLVVGIAGKVAAAVGAVGTRADKLLIGIGMIPRGEVGLIFASIGLTSGVLDKDLYGALLMVVLVTTLITPPLLRLRVTSTGPSDARETIEPTEEPPGGWLSTSGGVVMLHGHPPPELTIPLALRTSALLDNADPSRELLDWFADHRLLPLTWDASNTPTLLDLLRLADVRAWRFLEVTAVLERALPELAEAMRRRRADLHDLDPVGSFRFRVVEALHDVPVDDFGHDDALVMAALAVDVCDEGVGGRGCAMQLAGRLGRGADAVRVADIVDDARLLRAGAGDPDVFEERQLLELAAHFGSEERAREAHTLALALGSLSGWQRDALDERLRLVVEAIHHPEISGTEATNVAGARMQVAQRLAVSPAAIERLRHASTSYLLAHDAGELARQARLVEPVPRAGAVRVAVKLDDQPGQWQIDVACRDRPALLARLAATLSDLDLDVVDASVATWPDGAVLDSFVVVGEHRPDPGSIARAMERALRARMRRPKPVDLVLQFDNDSLPWHTACLATGPDRHGALAAISTAFASAGVVVHTARVSSHGGLINDRFSVSDRLGRKLDDQATQRVRAALAGERVSKGGRRH